MPDLQPGTETEVAEIVRDAAARRAALAVCGGGTRGPSHRVAGDRLATAALNGITLYEPGALTLVARAGTPLDEVEAALAAERQHLPFEVPDMRGLLGRVGLSTLGGVVASNASGPRRVRAGACRDSLIGVRFVDGAGNVIKNGGRVMKNVTGYDLVKLLAGSHGTLGVLTEVSFKVLPMPDRVVTLVLRGLDDARAVAAMAAALGSPYEVTGAAHWPGEGTFLRIEGFEGSVAHRGAQLSRHLEDFAPVGIEEDAAARARWRAIRDVAAFHGLPGDVWRLSVRPSDAPALVALSGALARLYDWGGGRIWLLLPEGTDLRSRLGSHGGHATLIRTEATPSAMPVFPPEAPAVAGLSAALRAKFDPRGILNPGLMA
jgi:glycolate oxidase FAD binding subunit